MIPSFHLSRSHSLRIAIFYLRMWNLSCRTKTSLLQIPRCIFLSGFEFDSEPHTEFGIMFRCIMIVVIFVLLCGSHAAEPRERYNACSCTNVRIPPLLCSKCRLRPLDSPEKAAYKKDIIDFEKPGCLAEIEKYVRINPCDTTRAKFLAGYKNGDRFSYERIAQLMYTVCEQCCDMIPIGSKVKEFWKRRNAGTLHTDTRGNGVAHYYYDICKLFPNATRFIRPNWKDIDNLASLCTAATNWMESDLSKNWPKNANAKGIPQYLRNALKMMANTLGCRGKQTWQDCVVEEQSIGRI